MVTVGVLALHDSKETKAILNSIESLGHQTEWLKEENIEIWLKNGEIQVKPDVDIVINRLLMSTTEQPLEAIGLAKTYKEAKPILNRPSAVMSAIHKFSDLAVLSSAGLQVPKSYLALDSYNINQNRESFGEEVVYKTTIGTHGGDIWKLDTSEPIGPEVGGRQMFLQEFIDLRGGSQHDFRIYVVGEEVVGAMKRSAPEGEWRSNIALGAKPEKADIPDKVKNMAINATKKLGLDIAGVDIMEDNDSWYIIEVNPTAGFKGLFKATGKNPGPYIASMAIKKAGGHFNTTKVEELAKELDDSEPSSRPESLGEEYEEDPVIGYIAKVLVRGTEDTKTVMAKSDTGAARTSIDLELAAEIGAGPIKKSARVRSGTAKKSRVRPVVDLVVRVNGRWHDVTASVEDRQHMDYQVLLGRDILEDYKIDVDKIEE